MNGIVFCNWTPISSRGRSVLTRHAVVGKYGDKWRQVVTWDGRRFSSFFGRAMMPPPEWKVLVRVDRLDAPPRLPPRLRLVA